MLEQGELKLKLLHGAVREVAISDGENAERG
jgi:hypothetical protein